MNNNITFFPVIDDRTRIKLGFSCGKVSFSYKYQGAEHDLEIQSLDGESRFSISDPRATWSPDEMSIIIRKGYVLNHRDHLFGAQGVAPKSAKIGLGVVWTSKKSSQRGAFPVCEISFLGQVQKTFLMQQVFQRGMLRGELQMELVAYIKSPGMPRHDEKHLANKTGMILGTLDSFSVMIDGAGSVFPIVDVNEPGQPLWWVTMDFFDPTSDAFSEENVAINLNSAHPDYSRLKSEEGIDKNSIMVEVVSTAVQIIYERLKQSEYFEQTMRGNDIEPGSISEALKYIVDVYELNDLEPERFAKRLRHKIGGGD